MSRHTPKLCCIALTLLATPAHAQCLECCEVIADPEGEAGGDLFGWKSNAIGDVTGDLVSDYVISAPQHDAGGFNAGRVYVHDGATGIEEFHVDGGGVNWQLGIDTGPAGDVNDDDVPDFIAGAPINGTGRAVVYSGVDGSVIETLTGEAIGSQFGFRVAGGGDFDGDDVADVLVTARFFNPGGAALTGRAYVYSGVDFALICTMDGEGAGDEFGTAAAFVGDADGNGCDEVVIGARNAGPGQRGRAYIFEYDGKSCALVRPLDPLPTAVDFGHLFADGGRDVTGDTVPDVYVGDFTANRAYIFNGVTGGVHRVLSGDGSGGFGLGEMIDDVSGDGLADLIIAAWVSPVGAPRAGKIFVYTGNGDVVETFTHTVAQATFGFDANGLGDVDGDGRGDYLVTAAEDLGARGKAYIIKGGTGGPRPGDVDGDCVTSTADLLLLLAAWGPCDECPEDLTGDGVVDAADLVALLAGWGG
jgi:hypothetical protein